VQQKDDWKRMEGMKNLTMSDSVQHVAAWLPNDQELLMVSYDSGRGQLTKLNINTSAKEILAPGQDDQTWPEVNPDGMWYFYWSSSRASGEGGTAVRLMRISAAGGTPETMMEAPADGATDLHCPTIESGSCVLSLTEHGELCFYKFDATSGKKELLARIRVNGIEGLRWAITQNADRVAVAGAGNSPHKIQIMNLGTAGETELEAPTGTKIYQLGWVRGDRALFVAGCAEVCRLYRIQLSGETSVLMDGGRNEFNSAPVVSHDGSRAAFDRSFWRDNVWMLENF